MSFIRNYFVPALIGAGIALIIIGLTGCSVGTANDPATGYKISYIQVDDGRAIPCLYAGGGITCDWDNAE